MTLTRQQYLLIALVVAAVAAGLMQWRAGSGSSSSPAAAPAAARPAQGTQSRGGDGSVTDLRLDRLKGPHPQAEDPNRNPFRFRPREAPPPAEAPERALPPAPIVPAGPPPPPPIPLKFIGLLDAPVRIGRVAILSDSRGTVFYGKEGDIIDGRYQVLRIGAESAELSYADGRGRQTLRLSGQ
jgi:hypothetical protein